MKRILFVDDEPFVLEALGRLLREFRDQWEIHFAEDGLDALKKVAEIQPDMIISDVRMPEMSGLELLEKLQEDEKTRNIPVVILTGDHERTLKRRALDLGAVDLLNKPINKEDLVSRIKNVLRIKKYQDIIIEKNKALEKQLIISQKMELVGVMAGGAVHDISNLLSVILGYSSLLVEDPLDSMGKGDEESMDRIRIAAEKASGVVEQILRFSRIDNSLTFVNLGQLLNEILTILSVSIPPNMEIYWFQPKTEYLVRGNAIKFQQVIMNICLNAVQAMGKRGSLRLGIKKRKMDEKQWVCVAITDTGPGMGPEVMEKIFEPLFTTKEPGKGTGLGLFVVKHIVDECGGRIEVDSEIGKGTTFRVYLPV